MKTLKIPRSLIEKRREEIGWHTKTTHLVKTAKKDPSNDRSNERQIVFGMSTPGMSKSNNCKVMS